MDSLSGHPSVDDADAIASATDVGIGTDERRMHVRAYNHWVSLLDGRDYPSIEDLDPDSITEDTLLAEDLGLDSFSLMSIMGEAEEELDIEMDETKMVDIYTVGGTNQQGGASGQAHRSPPAARRGV